MNWDKKIEESWVWSTLVTISVFGTYIWFSYNRAWLGDDAYITLRTVDNFNNGFGLVWNVGERVQSYTHPLWMFLISAFYAFTHEAYFTTLFLSLGISILVIIIFYFLVAQDQFVGAVCVISLALSGAYLDYSTSGLENPLTHLLIMIFAWIYFKIKASPKRLFFLSFITSLAIFNRQDSALLFLAPLMYSFWQIRSWKNFGLTLLGQFPFFCWEIFAIIYYGFFFPNTAYAKLYNNLPEQALLEKGFVYLLSTFKFDPWTIILMVSGLLAIYFLKIRKPALFFGISAVIYLAYVTYIGGDFMVGRFYTAPLLMAVILIAQIPFTYNKFIFWLFFIIVGICFSYTAPIPAWANSSIKFVTPYNFPNGIADERMFYFTGTGLNSGNDWKTLPQNSLRLHGLSLRDKKEKVAVETAVGLVGYYAGQKVYIVDELGLTDPFLARLAPDLSQSTRIGHFIRRIPDGYLESLADGKNEILNKNLKTYYDHLTIITRGPIWDWYRFVYILKVNLGLYNNLLKE